MAEGFELVRTIRQHLRRSAALLDETRFDEALAEVEQALALDAHSLPGLALRDRICAARAAASQATVIRSGPDRVQGPRPFVPHGVNAASWRGFEQRITERRFRALLDAINTAIVVGDAAAARVALDEARELRPDAPELADFETRVSAVPVAPPVSDLPSQPRVWMRAMGAAAIFLVGVSLLLGLEWMRLDGAVAPAAVATAPQRPAAAVPAQDFRRAQPSDERPMFTDEESVPAEVTPPEPLLRPRATTGGSRSELIGRPVALREAAPPPVARAVEPRTVSDEEPVRANGEVSDDYVAAPRPIAVVTQPTDNGGMSGNGRTNDVATNADLRGRTAPPAASAGTVSTVPGVEQGRVQEVLRQYARAYGELDASAARAVWPSVDEKALARAFQNLASQNVSFDNCDIDIRGAVANASCRGQASYVGKVGSREPRTEARLWRFELRRDGDAWKIENAEARRQAATTNQDRQ